MSITESSIFEYNSYSSHQKKKKKKVEDIYAINTKIYSVRGSATYMRITGC